MSMYVRKVLELGFITHNANMLHRCAIIFKLQDIGITYLHPVLEI